jgi:LPS sulfotransferase NodH
MTGDCIKFAILAEGRTGSSHLVHLLNRHPEILCHGESFHGRVVHVQIPSADRDADTVKGELLELRAREPLAYLERIYAVETDRRIVGFKIFPPHNPPVLEHIMENAAIRKIVLFRSNLLARYASLMSAHQAGEWRSGSDKPQVEFDGDEFSDHCRRYTASTDRIIRTLTAQKQPFWIVRYDELNNSAMIGALVRFLGAEDPMPEDPIPARGRGAPNILSRFSNPEVAKAFLKSKGLMQWAFESDMMFANPLQGRAAPPKPMTQ